MALSYFDRDQARRLCDQLGEGTYPFRVALDRRSNRELVSIAGCGFLAAASAVLIESDPGALLEHVESCDRTLEMLLAANPAENHGWLSHFTNLEGVPLVGSEVSTIDTALLFGGHLLVANYSRGVFGRLGLGSAEALLDRYEERIAGAIAAVKLTDVVENGHVLHGFVWPGEHGVGTPAIIPYNWNDTSEGAIIYWLFGDRLQAEGYRSTPWRPEIRRTDFPLFVYCYPLCFPQLGKPVERDEYRQLLVEALEYQHAAYGFVGQTATDGPVGYSVDSPTVIAPILLAALSADDSLPHVRETLAMLVERGVAPMTPAYDMESGWVADDLISIDVGSAVLLDMLLRGV